MHISILPLNAASIACVAKCISCRVVCAIETDFVNQLLDGIEELRLLAFGEKFLVLRGSVGQEQTATSWNLEGTRGVLVGPGLTKKSESDPGPRQCPRIIFSVHLSS